MLLKRIGVAAGFAALLFSATVQAQTSLGTAQSFAVLGGSTVTNTGPSVIGGDVGVSPGSAITGFPPGILTPPGAIHAADTAAASAQASVTTQYNALVAAPCTLDLTGQNLGNRTLTPGTYCFSSTAQLTGPLTLDAQGNAAAAFIFKIGTALTTASNSSVNMIGGNPCGVMWQIGSSATLGTATSFIGNLIALTSITLVTNTSIIGRALARNGAVTLDTNTVSFAPCTAAGVPPVPPVPTLSTWMMIVLVGLLALAGFATLRRRKTYDLG